MCRWLIVWSTAAVALLSLVAATNCSNSTDVPHSRKKRLIYMSSERRLTLPPSTLLIITPTLSLPFARNFPTGYGASMTISIPFKVEFDNLGLTSEENPFGIWPEFWNLFRKKRNAELPGISWAGGDREMLYQAVEDSLFNMGMDGRGCLLRAVCEVFQIPLINHGFFGEVLELFLSASHAPYSDQRLGDYVRAERAGRKSGDCSEYTPLCPHSLFSNPGQAKWTDAEEYMSHYNNKQSQNDASPQDEVDPKNDTEPQSRRQTQNPSESRDKTNKYPKKATQEANSGCKNRPR